MLKCALCLVFILLTNVAALAGTSFSLASIYSQKDGKTASGESYSSKDLTAAHRSLPFGTVVRVTNLQNGRTVKVRINDRGPFKKNRIIDLTPAAAQKLSFSGLVPVTLEVVTGLPSVSSLGP
jgi:rare lipoprotein A